MRAYFRDHNATLMRIEMVDERSEEMRVLRTLQDIRAFERAVADKTSAGDAPLGAVRAVVRGQFVRKRKLS